MSSEKQLASRMRTLMQENEWDPVRVENGVDQGCPDNNTIHGWFEFKYVPVWPKRGGPLRIPHFTAQQRVWLRRRWRAHGGEGHGAWMILQVAKDVMVFDGETAAKVVGFLNRTELFEAALGYWEGRFPTAAELSGAVLL
jgi:hypothetical protein